MAAATCCLAIYGPDLAQANGLNPTSTIGVPSSANRDIDASGPSVYETNVREERHKVLCPVWETEYREERYTVRRPMIETTMREQRFTVRQPVTTFVSQQVDQGKWVKQQVRSPNRTATELRWVPAGWNVDPKTGLQYWRGGMLRPVQVERPGRVRTHRVWQPNLVTTSVPKTTYATRVEVRKVPMRTVRFVAEERVRMVPVRTCRMVEQEIVRRVPVITSRIGGEKKIQSAAPCDAPEGVLPATHLAPPPAPERPAPQLLTPQFPTPQFPTPQLPTPEPRLDPSERVPAGD
jgi:hypothetical protein